MNGRLADAGSGFAIIVPTIAVVLLAGAAAAQAPENLSVARTYGAGVHAYFTGAFDRSYDDLTAVIEAGSSDPRARYFRGLSALRLGRLDEAEADFSEGAMLEAQAIAGWPVSRSLERVQGPDRLQLERHRVRARVAALQRDRAAERRRYSDMEDAQSEVLRRRRPAGLPAPVDEPGNPFADQPEATPAPPKAPEPATPEVVPENPPAEPEPVAAGSSLEPEMEPPAGEPAPGALEVPAEEPAATAPESEPVMEAEQPAVPAEPAITEPEAPAEEPAIPAEPVIPEEPVVPAEPATTEEPAVPAEPPVSEEPAVPAAPEEPAAPAEPVAPAEPPAGGEENPFGGEPPAADAPAEPAAPASEDGGAV